MTWFDTFVNADASSRSRRLLGHVEELVGDSAAWCRRTKVEGEQPATVHDFSTRAASHPRDWTAIEFRAPESLPWIGRFDKGLGGLNATVRHPNGTDVVVIASGSAWLVRVRDRHAEEIEPAVFRAWRLTEPERLVLSCQDIAFLCLGRNGPIWKTDRISFDGFRDLRVDGDFITGKAWQPSIEDEWVSFRVSLADGRLAGGAWGRWKEKSFEDMRRDAAI